MRVLAGTGVLSNMGFTAVGASLLFFGSRMPRKQLWVPVALLIGSDVYLTFGPYHQSAMPWDELLIWAWYGGICLFGILLKDRVKPLNLLGASLTSSISLFLVATFAPWVGGSIGYPKTWAGLMASYVAGIPLFQRGLPADALVSPLSCRMSVLPNVSA